MKSKLPAAPMTTDGVLVIRLWREQHDGRVRARLLVIDEVPEPLIGSEQILTAVAAAISRFESRHQ